MFGIPGQFMDALSRSINDEGTEFLFTDTAKTGITPPPAYDDFNYGKKSKSQEEGRTGTGNPLGVSDQTMETLKDFMKTKLETEFNNYMNNTDTKDKDELKAERERFEAMKAEHEAEVNKKKTAPGDGKDDPSYSLIEFLKKRDAKAAQQNEVKQLDDNEHFKNARTQRMMRQEILVAKLQQGAMNNNARLSNANRRTAGKVLQNRRLDHVQSRGKPMVSPMNAISFNMGVGTQ